MSLSIYVKLYGIYRGLDNMVEAFNNLTFEVKSEKEITGDDLAEFAAFVKEEKELFLALLNDAQEKRTQAVIVQGSALRNHFWAHKMIQRIGSYQETSARFVFARNQNSLLVGYRMFSLYPLNQNLGYKASEPSFTGVKSQYQKRGIGTSILLKSHEVLLDLGISQYTASFHPRMVRILDATKVSYTSRAIPKPSHGRKLVKVHLQ